MYITATIVDLAVPWSKSFLFYLHRILYGFSYTIGSSTFGEVFNPARDCSDIVDHLPGAQDGFYWIVLNNKTKHKVLNSSTFCTPINIFPIVL
jgi:hypothetical protein